ncbi:MAG: glycosyltransferase family 2 protein [Planctomycetales bacterium]|nr:glycosyltransferase family 2 protein [Planctomycetales bacterium]
MPNLSIIIPAVGDHELMESGLVSVLQHRPADAEVVVVLDRPYEDPYDLQQELTFVRLSKRARVTTCLREGIAASRGKIVHLLGCGWEVAEDWTDSALAAMEDSRVASAVPCVFASPKSEQIRSLGVSYSAVGRLGRIRRLPKSARQRERILGPELGAAFYRREALDQIGGVPTDLGSEAAAVEIALRLRRAGYEAALADETVVYAADALAASAGEFRRSADAERLFWRHLPQQGRMAALLAHPWLVAGKTLLGLPRPAALARLTGHLWGSVSALTAAAYRRNLTKLTGLADAEDATTLRLDPRDNEASHEHRRAA